MKRNTHKTKKLLEQGQKRYEKHVDNTWMHVDFEVGQHKWLNILDLKMFDGLAPCFIAKYAGLYEILHKSHPDMYTLKLSIIIFAHLTFHVLKLKLFLHDEQKLVRKQREWLKVDAIEHRWSKLKAYSMRHKHTSNARNTWWNTRVPIIRGNMDEAYSYQPFARSGEQVQARKGSRTWSEMNMEEKEGPTYKQPKCWWRHLLLKWGKTPAK